LKLEQAGFKLPKWQRNDRLHLLLAGVALWYSTVAAQKHIVG
jgi:hypothetical protein